MSKFEKSGIPAPSTGSMHFALNTNHSPNCWDLP